LNLSQQKGKGIRKKQQARHPA